ncbi:oligosaccharide repeat unit polymerase [Pedobacter sp. G11]|uniref:O-antigen polymerase n=1 Tax=Pedobacter sp. G11 TaxID=2482728 RepID=UPI000F5D6513|nr:O-antigen polymerase [Pedobacter sp. G11]AZI25161.1 oligosaccharide repeat unit polymerase [Pedobacter sp. G11]
MINKPYVLILIVGALLFLDAFLVYRYLSWGSTMDEILPFTGFLLLAETITVFSIIRFNQIINPFTLYSLFIYIAGFSFLIISDRQIDYDYHYILIIVLSIAFFIAGGLVAMKTFTFSFKSYLPPLSQRLSLAFLLLVFVAGIGVFILEVGQLGYLPVFNLANAEVYQELNENEVTPLHNFIIVNSVLPAMFYILFKRKTLRFWQFLLLTAVCGFIILNFFSRQIIVLFFFSMLIAYSYYKTIPLLKFFSIGVVCTVIFIVLGQLRGGSSEESNSMSVNDFLRDYGDITKPTNIIETYLSLYGAVNLTSGNGIVSDALRDDYVSYGLYSARPVLTIIPVDKNAIYPPLYSSYTKLGTYLVDPFLDFRWIGVIGLNFMYGLFAMNSFKNYLAKNGEYYIVEWSLFIFCIFMCAFTNFFHMFFVAFFFIINRIAIK